MSKCVIYNLKEDRVLIRGDVSSSTFFIEVDVESVEHSNTSEENGLQMQILRYKNTERKFRVLQLIETKENIYVFECLGEVKVYTDPYGYFLSKSERTLWKATVNIGFGELITTFGFNHELLSLSELMADFSGEMFNGVTVHLTQESSYNFT